MVQPTTRHVPLPSLTQKGATMSLFRPRTPPHDTEDDAGVDLASKPTTYPPIDHARLRQSAAQTAERDWSSGAHDEPGILEGSLERRLEHFHRQADRLRAETRARHIMAQLANRINRSRIITGEDSQAPQPGTGQAALDFAIQQGEEHLTQLRAEQGSRADALATAGIPIPAPTWWHACLLRLQIALPPLLVAGGEGFVLTGVMRALTGTESLGEAIAWATLPLLFLVLMPEVVGSYERGLDKAGVPEADMRRTTVSRAMTLAYGTSVALSLVRAAYALNDALASAASQSTAGSISAPDQAGASLWELTGIVIGFIGISLAFVGMVWVLRHIARHSTAPDRLAYVLAARAADGYAQKHARVIHKSATLAENLLVADADLETTNAAYDLEESTTIEAIVREAAEAYLLEFINQAGSASITDAIRVWAEEATADEPPREAAA